MVRHLDMEERAPLVGGLHIAEALESEVEEIDRIQREAFRTPWSSDLIRGAVLNPRYDVRTLTNGMGRVLGFYIAHGDHHASNLDNLAVDAPERSLGLGSRLLMDWVSASQAANRMRLTLQVNTDNRRAQKLYERFDFRAVKLLVSYYPNGDDAYQMELIKGSPPQGFRLP